MSTNKQRKPKFKTTTFSVLGALVSAISVFSLVQNTIDFGLASIFADFIGYYRNFGKWIGFRAHMAGAAAPLTGLTSFLRAYAEDAPGARVHACLLLKTLLEATATDSEISGPARDYLNRMKAEFEAGFSAAKEAGDLPHTADTARLARRYQAALTALQIELQRGLSGAELSAFVDDLIEPFEQLAREAAS